MIIEKLYLQGNISGMISVNSNGLGLIVQRNLNKSTNLVSTALERMSTGYKVNRAKDDAANLQISQRLTNGINGCNVLKNGASTALDMLSTHEGAMSALNDSLLRIRDLTLQKMNTVYDQNAIAAMDVEIEQQILNIEQICNATNFNGKKLLDGSVTDMLIPLYDKGSELSVLDISDLFTELESVSVLAGDRNIFFINAQPGGLYYADFEGKVFEITNNSAKSQQIIYNYNDSTQEIEFVEGEDVVAQEYGGYENNYKQLGKGEKYLNIGAGQTYYVQSNNKVYEFKNTNATSQIAIFKDNGAGDFDIISGAGIQKNFMYNLDSYTTIGSGQSLELRAGSTQNVIFQNKLYKIDSTKSQTLIFNNSGGNLNTISGTDGVTISKIGDMETTVTSGLSKYMELNPNETLYYEFNGNVFKVTNTKATKQTLVLDNNNNIKENTGNFTRTQMPKTPLLNFSSFSNAQSMNVTAGNDYFVKNADGSGLVKISANESGMIFYDKLVNGITNFNGVSTGKTEINGSDYEDITPDALNQFDIFVAAHSTKTLTIGNQIYTIENNTDADFTKNFDYDSTLKTITESDLSEPDPALKLSGIYVAETTDGTAIDPATSRYLNNFSGTTYIKSGNEIYEIKNNGAVQDVLFDFDSATGVLTPKNTSDIQITKMDQATFDSLDGTNFSKTINSGQSQYMMFTINGVQRTYKVTNNSADKQAVIFSKTNNISLVSGDGIVIEELSNMKQSSGIGAGSFYVDFNGATKKNIYMNGNFYEITNNSGTTALFTLSTGNLVQHSGTTTSNSKKSETNISDTTSSQYYLELDAHKEQLIKMGKYAFQLNNNSALNQTQIFEQNNDFIMNLNPNATANNIPLTNDPMQQMLIKIDWAMEEIGKKRSKLGAYANVIEASISRNNNFKENLTAARSTILDADIAQESCTMVQNRILQNVSSSLLSQVNMIKKDLVLRLIQ